MFTAKPGRLILSCQPSHAQSPLNDAAHMAAMAAAGELGGATALRINSPEHVAAVKACTGLPVIGLWKRDDGWGHRVITPDMESARALAEAGADVIAVDATAQAHPVPGRLAMLIEAIHEELHLPVMADISTVAEGVRAAGYGADLVGTTLSGYTVYSPQGPEPDLTLVQELVQAVPVPVIAEGRYTSPEQARAALLAGAAFVVVGNALTAPDVSVARFVAAMEPEPAPPGTERYWSDVAAAVARVQATQGSAIRQAAELLANAAHSGGRLHVCGTGWEAGAGMALAEALSGVLAVRTITADLPAAASLGSADLCLIISHSGMVGPTAAWATDLKRGGRPLLLVTSPQNAARATAAPVEPSGEWSRLAELADVLIEDGVPRTDASAGGGGSISAVTAPLILQALAAETLRIIRTLFGE